MTAKTDCGGAGQISSSQGYSAGGLPADRWRSSGGPLAEFWHNQTRFFKMPVLGSGIDLLQLRMAGNRSHEMADSTKMFAAHQPWRQSAINDPVIEAYAGGDNRRD